MKDRELYELEMELIEEIHSKKTTFWQKVLAVFELSAIADKH